MTVAAPVGIKHELLDLAPGREAVAAEARDEQRRARSRSMAEAGLLERLVDEASPRSRRVGVAGEGERLAGALAQGAQRR